MNQLELFKAPTPARPAERAANIYQARVYLAQARATPHRSWCFTLLAWAGKCRRLAQGIA